MYEYKTLQLDLLKCKQGEVHELYVPKQNYLTVDGTAKPGSEEYGDAIGQLYSVAYTVKFMPKKGMDIPGYEPGYPAGALMASYKDLAKGWKWKMMMPQPSFVTDAVVKQAQSVLTEKHKPADLVRLETIELGHCVQTLHIGPYDAEQPTVDLLTMYLEMRGLEPKEHIEIYLNDPGRVSPDTLKTILRFPYRVT